MQPSNARPNVISTLERRNLVLQLIPYAGRGALGSSEIHQQVLNRLPDSRISLRTIQRDLQVFCASGKIESLGTDDVGASQWQRVDKAPDASLKEGPLKSAKVALGLVMLIEHAAHLVHGAALKDLQESYQQSKQLLERIHPLEGRWLNKVISATQHLQLLPARINETHLHEVQRALLEGYQLQITYFSRRSRTEKPKIISPLGLSYQDSSIYVVCLEAGEPEVRTLALHRFRSTKALESRQAQMPSDFDLRQHVQKILVEKAPIQLKLRINSALRERLDPSETPLTQKQKLTPLNDGWHLLECEVEYSQGLKWWLLSHGATLEVLEPASLRHTIAESVKTMASFYEKT